MTERFRTAVYRIMLCTSVCLEVFVVVALHSEYVLYSEDCIEIWIFTVGLLSTSPSRVTEDVHVRTPEGKFGVTRVVDHTHRYIEHSFRTVPVCTCFVGYCGEDVINHLRIESGCHSDRLRIHGISVLTDSVACFAPPVV